MYYFTTAPSNYDYWYVTTVEPANIPGWRVIKVDDLHRFENCQVPRYNSGFHIALKVDDGEAVARGLTYTPTTNQRGNQ
jgi:hypothetical protein